MAESAIGSTPVAVFQGYDSVTGAGRSTAVRGQTQTVGGSSGVSYRVCQDISTLAQTLNISQSLSVGYGPIGSVDEKMDFMRKLNVTTNSISIVVYARHVLGTDVVTDVAVSDSVKPPGNDNEIREFFSAYGDSYITSRTRGGEYYAVYSFYAETKEEQQSLVLDMKAHGLYDGVTVDASLQTKLSTFTTTAKTRSALNQNVSGIQNPKLPDGGGIVAYALSFPSIILDAAAIISFESGGYEHVPKFGTFGAVPANRNYFVGTGLVDGLTASLVRVQQLRNQIAWLREVYGYYGFSGDTKLTDAAGTADTDLGAINAQIQGWEKDPVQSFTTPSLPSLGLGAPSLNYAIGYSPSYGGGGGDPFFDINPTTYIQQHTSISNVQMRGSGYVDALIVTYQSSGGVQQFKHGGDGGNLTAPLTLLPGQFVNRIHGRAGGYVDNLTVAISDGRAVGVGGGGGDPFDWSVPSGSFVLGFMGRSGRYLDQIQVIYATINAAKWQ
jgi:hypothetical protein